METFDAIYQVNYPNVFRLAYKMLGDRDSAADIAQEVFTDLYQQMNRRKSIQSERSWLYKVACNKCIDLIKKEKGRFLRLDSKKHESLDLNQEIDCSLQVKAAIDRLNETDRLIVVLYSEGLSYKEIAEASGVNFTSVGKTLSRALKKLETELKPIYHELFVV